MNESLNNINTIIKNTSNLIFTLQATIDQQMKDGKIDSQAIYALTKLIDSLVKLNKTEKEMKESGLYEEHKEPQPPEITEEDKTIFQLYREKLYGPDVIKVYPRQTFSELDTSTLNFEEEDTPPFPYNQ